MGSYMNNMPRQCNYMEIEYDQRRHKINLLGWVLGLPAEDTVFHSEEPVFDTLCGS